MLRDKSKVFSKFSNRLPLGDFLGGVSFCYQPTTEIFVLSMNCVYKYVMMMTVDTPKLFSKFQRGLPPAPLCGWREAVLQSTAERLAQSSPHVCESWWTYISGMVTYMLKST